MGDEEPRLIEGAWYRPGDQYGRPQERLDDVRVDPDSPDQPPTVDPRFLLRHDQIETAKRSMAQAIEQLGPGYSVARTLHIDAHSYIDAVIVGPPGALSVRCYVWDGPAYVRRGALYVDQPIGDPLDPLTKIRPRAVEEQRRSDITFFAEQEASVVTRRLALNAVPIVVIGSRFGPMPRERLGDTWVMGIDSFHNFCAELDTEPSGGRVHEATKRLDEWQAHPEYFYADNMRQCRSFAQDRLQGALERGDVTMQDLHALHTPPKQRPSWIPTVRDTTPKPLIPPPARYPRLRWQTFDDRRLVARIVFGVALVAVTLARALQFGTEPEPANNADETTAVEVAAVEVSAGDQLDLGPLTADIICLGEHHAVQLERSSHAQGSIVLHVDAAAGDSTTWTLESGDLLPTLMFDAGTRRTLFGIEWADPVTGNPLHETVHLSVPRRSC